MVGVPLLEKCQVLLLLCGQLGLCLLLTAVDIGCVRLVSLGSLSDHLVDDDLVGSFELVHGYLVGGDCRTQLAFERADLTLQLIDPLRGSLMLLGMCLCVSQDSLRAGSNVYLQGILTNVFRLQKRRPEFFSFSFVVISDSKLRIQSIKCRLHAFDFDLSLGDEVLGLLCLVLGFEQ